MNCETLNLELFILKNIMSEDISKLEQQRRERLEQIRGLGLDPYGARFDNTEMAQSILDRFIDDDDSPAGLLCRSYRVAT